MSQLEITCRGQLKVGRRWITTPARVRVPSERTALTLRAAVKSTEDSEAISNAIQGLGSHALSVWLELDGSAGAFPDLSRHPHLDRVELFTFRAPARAEHRLPVRARRLALVSLCAGLPVEDLPTALRRCSVSDHVSISTLPARWDPRVFHALRQVGMESLLLVGFEVLTEAMIEPLVDSPRLRELRLGLNSVDAVEAVATSRALEVWPGCLRVGVAVDVQRVRDAIRSSRVMRRSRVWRGGEPNDKPFRAVPGQSSTPFVQADEVAGKRTR